MTRLSWDERLYKSGLDRGVLFPHGSSGEVWNGLISVNERAADIRERVRYHDGRKVVNTRFEDSFSASIECFSYPEPISSRRTVFDMTYRVQTATGHEIHLVYNALAQIGEKSYEYEDVSPFTVDIFTRPALMPEEIAPSAHLVIDLSTAYSDVVSSFETTLYGSDSVEPHLPSPEELFAMFEAEAVFKVVEHADGTFTVTAPDDMLQMLDATTFQITSPSAIFVDEETYTLKSW